MFEFFENERRCAFAHDETVAQFVEWPTGKLRITTATHRLDDVECADRDRGQRCFRTAGNDDIGEIVANVTKRFAD